MLFQELGSRLSLALSAASPVRSSEWLSCRSVQSNAPIDAKAGVTGMPESLAQYLLAIVRFGIVEMYRGEVIKGWE